MYDVEPEDEKQRMKTPVRLRRPVLRHSYDSWPSMMKMGGLWSFNEPVRTASSEYDAPRNFDRDTMASRWSRRVDGVERTLTPSVRHRRDSQLRNYAGTRTFGSG